MQLEYFQLIDRIVDLNLEDEDDYRRGSGSHDAHHLRGTFSRATRSCPACLLTEAMAQTSGWLLLGLMKFERMPFLAIVKEAKMRGFVSPGQLLTIEAKLEHEGSGFAVTKAKIRVGNELKCSAETNLPPYPLPQSGLCACTWTRWPTRSAFRCRR